MHTHPHLASQLASERQRGTLARASQQHLARQLRGLAGTSRPAPRASWPTAWSSGGSRPAVLPS